MTISKKLLVNVFAAASMAMASGAYATTFKVAVGDAAGGTQ